MFKVFFVLLGTQSLTEPYGTDSSKRHHTPLGSAIFHTDHEYHGSFRNHENMSNIDVGGKVSSFGEDPRGTGDSATRQELTGFETATPARIQGSRQSTPKFSNQTGQSADEAATGSLGYADDDPWFGLDANPGGHISLPGAAAEPAC